MEIKFFQLSVWLLHASFQLLWPEGGEFIIGTRRRSCSTTTGSGSAACGTSFSTARRALSCRCGPDLAVQIAPDGGEQFMIFTIDDADVQMVNKLQIRPALRYIFYRAWTGGAAVRTQCAVAGEGASSVTD